MSVCTFGVHELANIAHVIVRDRPTHFHDADYRSDIRAAAEALALVSEANVACFNHRYSHLGAKCTPHSWEEISVAATQCGDSAPGEVSTLARALATASLLHYNCDDDGGDFTLKIPGAHAALIHILEGLCTALARKAGVTT